jgi:hypothetical protein
VGFVPNLHPERVEEHDRIHPLEGPALPRRHFGDDAVRDRADQIRRHLHAVHLGEEALNFAHGHPAGVERENLVVEAGEAPLVFRNQPRLKRPVTIARHGERQRPVIGQHRLTAGPVAMIRGGVRFLATRRIAQMVGQLAAERALDDRVLEATDRRVQFFWRDRALAHELIENIGWDRREWRVRGQRLPFSAHRLSSCYAPHTKFRIPSSSLVSRRWSFIKGRSSS